MGNFLELTSTEPSDPRLRSVIASYGLLTGSAGGAKDLAPRVGALLSVTIRGGRRVDGAAVPEAALFGVRTRASRMEMEPGSVDRIHVQFRPCGLSRLAAVPAAEVAERVISAEDLLPQGSLQQLACELEGAATLQQRALVLDEFFLHLLQPEDPSAALLQAAAEALCRNPGAGLDSLFRGLPFGVRQAERLFSRHVGVSPRSFLRIARFHRAAQALSRERLSGQGGGLTEVGLEAGYYDQAHFSREFKRFSAVPPARFRAHGAPALPPASSG